MKYKFVYILIMVISITSVAATEIISAEQDANNRKYLINLNDNILTTIQMLQAFNYQGQEIYLIQNGDYYNSLLLDFTMQCSNLIENIRQAEELNPLDRDLQVRALIATIKPDVEFDETEISPKQKVQNRNFLKNAEIQLQYRLKSILAAIIEEEKEILNKGEVTQKYFQLHTHHFLFSLLEDFIAPSDLLSASNEKYLIAIVQSIDEALQQN
ncbi:MAG: hypothetical protein APR54_03555 [Candidatus Cloacimonas sp. SDB]|nr:MAG: hypothetical protein APR54_03555 [Candidatus Cloacimonas sp. SDB]